MKNDHMEMRKKKIQIRYKIVDSHKKMKQSTRERIAVFFSQVKEISLQEGYEQVAFCDWFEHEFAVSWFEIVVYDAKEVVGYLRCLRNPEVLEEWFIGDVHVGKSYRQQGIASKMYQKAIDEVKCYEAAEYIVSSVSKENSNSIGLHKKMNFFDTKKECDFPNFYFSKNETAYKRWLYHYLPVEDRKMAKEALLPLWRMYEKEQGMTDELEMQEHLSSALEKYADTEQDFETIWCGNRLVGFAYSDIEFCMQ